MNTVKNFLFKLGLVFFLIIASCGNDDDRATPNDPNIDNVDPDNPDPDNPDPNNPQPTGESMTYILGSVSDPNISGTVVFIAIDDGSTDIEIELQNTEAGEMHPGHVHLNTAVEGGDISISLNAVDGTTGRSATNVAALDNGTGISYDALLDFDGYINIHLNENDLSTLIAQGDIGQNELTGESKIYQMDSSTSDITGTVTFAERVNGEILACLELQNKGPRPAAADIFLNSVVEGGVNAISLTVVDSSGTSKTNIAGLDDGSVIDYTSLLQFDGHIAVSNSEITSHTFIAEGDIGQNELTGASKIYFLEEGNVTDPEATATFFERVSGEALAVIEMNTTFDGFYPSHIHMNDILTGGPSVFSFNSDFSAGGISKIHVAQLDDGTAFGYADVLTYDGYVDIHADERKLNLLLALGNIGSNEN